MNRYLYGFAAAVLTLALPSTFAWAQTPDTQQPTQANQPQQPTQPVMPDKPVTGNDSQTANEGSDADVIPAVTTSDAQNPPLGGSLSISPFSSSTEYSYILPQLIFFNTVNTNGGYAQTSSNGELVDTGTVMGGLTLEKVGSSNDLSFNYLGGRSFSPTGQIFNSTTQIFGFTDRWSGKRWGGSVSDQLSYTSEPYLGSGSQGIPGIGVSPGLGSVGGVSLQPSFAPNSTVVVPRTPLLDNSSVVELDYRVSPRATFSVAGSYLTVHYFGVGLINSNSAVAQAGYTYQLSARDTIAVVYLFDAVRFSGASESINDNGGELSYKRQLGRRFTFEAGGGPDVALIAQRGLNTQSLFTWRANSALRYHGNLTGLGLAYTHMLTGGAGVFLGSQMDSLTGNVSRQLSATWSINVAGSYALNKPIKTLTVAEPNNNYNTLTANLSISKRIGQSLNFTANYTAARQTSSESTCIVKSCGTGLIYQSVSTGLSWHPRRILY